MITFLKKIIPTDLFRWLQPIYHYKLALLGALIYRFPSRQLYVIGVTGTKGKSSVVEMINALLETAGWHTAVASTIRFKIGTASQRNLYKMTMPGRLVLQRLLRRAVTAGCTHAIIEMTSEGARQFRHRFIDLDALIFTNLSPEHIESHGSVEKYLAAKLSLARALASSPKTNKLLIVNADDAVSEKFVATAGPKVKVIKFYPSRDNEQIASPLPGDFNRANWLAALALGRELNVTNDAARAAIKKLTVIPGRVEEVVAQPFRVIVDYAHTVDSLTKLYQAFAGQRKICVLGGTGGGRDRWKRPLMGQLASAHCDRVIFTNEDPYDEDPAAIVAEVAAGAARANHEPILDRRAAIARAIALAQAGDVVLITGKGTDPYIVAAQGQKIPWDDARVAREELFNARTTRS